MYSLHSLTLGSDLTSFLMMGSSVVVTVWKIRSMRCIGFSFFTFTLKNKIKPCSISPSFAEFMDFYGLLQKIFVHSIKNIFYIIASRKTKKYSSISACSILVPLFCPFYNFCWGEVEAVCFWNSNLYNLRFDNHWANLGSSMQLLTWY